MGLAPWALGLGATRPQRLKVTGIRERGKGEQGSEGTGERGSRGAREQGSEGTGEQGSKGVSQKGMRELGTGTDDEYGL